MDRANQITEAEWVVMRVLWRQPGATAQDVIAALAGSADWTPATIKTLLHRLSGKGALSFEKTGKTYRYYPEVTEDECREVETQSFLERVFEGALTPMLLHLVKTRKLTQRQLAELEKILREQRRR